MATETEQLVVALEARIRDFERNFQRASRTANSQFSAVERRAQQSAARLESLMSTSALGVNRALGAIGLGISFDGIRRYADAWTEAGNKVKAAAAATGVQVRSLDQLKNSANDARTSLSDYVDLYARLTRASSGIAKNENEISRATTILAKSFKASGASASEAASGALQIGQALGSGVLQGDELRAIRENAQPIAQAIADAFGVPIGALKELGAQGKLTADRVFAAILAAGPKVEAQFSATTATIGDSFTRLSNEFTAWVGKTSEASGAAAAFKAVIDGLGANVAAVGNAAAAAAAVLLASYVPAMVRAGVATAAMVATNPFLLLATAAGAAAFAVTAFGDQIHPIPGELANLQDYAAAAWNQVKDGATVAADAISTAFRTVVDFLTNALDGVGVSWADVGAVIRGVANVIVNSLATAYELIVASWTKLPGAIADVTISAMNGMIGLIEDALNGVISLINMTVSALNRVGSAVGVELGTIGTVTLGRITNAYSGVGAAAGQAYGDALANMTRDRVGAALAGINAQTGAALDALRQRANQRAAERQQQEASTTANAEAAKTAPITGGKQEMPLSAVKEVADVQQRIAALQAEMAVRRSIPGSIEQQEAALERLKTAQDLVNAATKAGVPMTEDNKNAIGALADAYSRASQEAKALAQSQQEAAQKAQDLENSTKDTFKGFISDLAHGKSASDALRNALVRLGEKMVDLAFDNLWKGLMDNGGKGFFAQASAFLSPTQTKPTYAPGSSLQGVNFNPSGAITTPQATVSAGVVNVNGATPGLPNAAAPATATPGTTAPTAIGAQKQIDDAFGLFKKPAPQDAQKQIDAAFKLFDKPSAAQAVEKLAGGITPSMYDRAIPAAIRTNNPGAMAYASWQSKYGVLGRQDLNDGLGQGNNIAMFPTPEAGAAAQFDLLNRYGARGWDLRRAITTWSGGNSSDQYVNDVASRLGMSPDARLSDVMGDQATATRLAQYMAQQEAGRAYPMSDAQWGSSWNLYQQQNGGSPIDLAQLQQPIQQAQQQLTQLAQPLQNLGQQAMSAVPQLGNMASGVTGLIGPLGQVVPGIGNFGGAISGLLGQLGGAGGGGFFGIGKLFGFAEGGAVRGPGTSRSDDIPAMLSNGEFVVNAKSARRYQPLLEAINTGRTQKLADGGFASRAAFSSASTYAPNLAINVNGDGRQGNRLAQQIAGAVDDALRANQPRPDTFRRSTGQQAASAAAQLQTASARNN